MIFGLRLGLALLMALGFSSQASDCLSELEAAQPREPFRVVLPKKDGIVGKLTPVLSSTLYWPYLIKSVEAAAEVSHEGPSAFLKELLYEVDIAYETTGALDPITRRAAIPKKGPTMVYANHPFGFTDTIMVADAVLDVRKDVRIVSNSMVSQLVPREMSDLLITVDLDAPKEQKRAEKKRVVAEVREFLSKGGLVVIFPSGAVAEKHKYGEQSIMLDSFWRPGISEKTVNIPGVQFVPMYMPGENSWWFSIAKGDYRQALFPFETWKKRGSTQELVVGKPTNPEAISMFDLSAKSHIPKAAFLKLVTFSLTQQVQNVHLDSFQQVHRYFKDYPGGRDSSIYRKLVSEYMGTPKPSLITPFDRDIKAMLKGVTSLVHFNLILEELGYPPLLAGDSL